MRTVYAFCVALILSLSPIAEATVARAYDFEQKVVRADSIVLGRCIRQYSQFDPSGRWILTYTTFQVTRAYKGVALPEVTVVTPGGRVGTVHQETVGVPRFGEGDVNVLFISNTSKGSTVLFMDQGAYEVDARELTVAPVESELILVHEESGYRPAGAREKKRSLDQFETEIRNVLSRKSADLRKESSR